MHPSPIEGRHQHAWNKGKLVGQKPPLKLREIWAIRTRLQMTASQRGRARTALRARSPWN